MNPRSTIVRSARRAARLWPLLTLALCSFAETKDGAPLDPALPKTPLPPPLTVTGGFGEYRIGHFHAGLDFGTNHHVGMHVMAPADGWVERIRASGVGYGRSVYLHTNDGRLIQLGHLDAFVEPLASYVRARQDSTGQYEQDLWPAKNQFRFRAGQQIAWSGQSGAGGPHLHFEIRRGDMAFQPARAGLSTVKDQSPPSIVDLTLEPLDEESFIAGSAAPRTFMLRDHVDTLRAIGRLRAIVGARDGVWQGVDRMVPWSVGMEWDGKETECRFDSISWATDMVESDFVYDSGRVIGQKGIVLWAPAGFRPRVLRASVAEAEEAGTISIRRGDRPRRLVLRARDLGGNQVERSVVLAPWTGGLDTTGAIPPPAKDPGSALDVASLPGRRLRVTARAVEGWGPVTRILAGSVQRVVAGSRSPRGVSAVFTLEKPRGNEPWWAVIGSQNKGGILGGTFRVAEASPRDSTSFEAHSFRVRVPAGAVFEPTLLLARGDESTSSAGELVAAAPPLRIEPASLPLRRPIRIAMPGGSSFPPQVAFYRQGEDGWEWVGGSYDSLLGEFSASTRQLGQFELMQDQKAPRITLNRPPRRAPATPYPTWGVEATISEDGSGLDARASRLVIDGQPVPTEWDPEARVLRWRPARMPGKGTHRVEVVATDRAGNVARTTQTFVLD